VLIGRMARRRDRLDYGTEGRSDKENVDDGSAQRAWRPSLVVHVGFAMCGRPSFRAEDWGGAEDECGAWG
jgi:hypothetical protein